VTRLYHHSENLTSIQYTSSITFKGAVYQRKKTNRGFSGAGSANYNSSVLPSYEIKKVLSARMKNKLNREKIFKTEPSSVILGHHEKKVLILSFYSGLDGMSKKPFHVTVPLIKKAAHSLFPISDLCISIMRFHSTYVNIVTCCMSIRILQWFNLQKEVISELKGEIFVKRDKGSISIVL
jgi:hypothetical protein